MNTEMWIGEAIDGLRRWQGGDTFVLRDLFDGVKWNELAKGDRQLLGRTFKEKVKERYIPGVECMEGGNGPQRYRIVS